MAQDSTVLTIEVDLQNAEKELKDLQSEFDTLKKKQAELESQGKKNTDEYKNLTAQIKVNAKSQEQLGKVLKNNTGSYDQLSALYSKMKKELNAMSAQERKSAKGKEMANHAREIYEEMKRLQEETGKFQLNVGNYASALQGLGGPFATVGAGLGAVASGFTKTAKAAMSFVATPIGAVITAVVGALALMNKALSATAEGQQKLAKVTGFLKGILNGLVEVLVQSGEALAALFTGDWKGFKENIGDIGKAALNIGNVATETAKIAEAREKLTQQEKAYELEETKLNKQMAEQKLLMKDTTKSAEERAKALQTFNALEDKNLKVKKKYLTDRIALLKSEQDLTSNDAAANAEMIDLQKELVNLDTEIINKQVERLEVSRSIDQQEKSANKTTKQKAKTKKELIQEEIALEKAKLGAMKEGSEEYYKKQEEIANKEYKLAIENGTKEETAYQEKENKIKDIRDKRTKYLQSKSAEELQKVIDANNAEIDYYNKKNAYITDAEENKYQSIINEEQAVIDALNVMRSQNLISEKEYQDELEQITDRTSNKILATKKKEKQLEQDLYASATDNVIQSLTEITDVNSENSETMFNANKALQIAQTTIEGARAGIKIFADETAPYAVKVAEAAAIAGSTAATIAKISQTQFGSTSSSSSTSSISRTTTSVNDTLLQRTSENIRMKENMVQTVLVVDDVTAKQMQISATQKVAVV